VSQRQSKPLPIGIASARRHTNHIAPGSRKNVSIQDSRIAMAVSLALAAASQVQAQAQPQPQQAGEESKTLSKISVQATEVDEGP
jgi:hypothetical protein